MTNPPPQSAPRILIVEDDLVIALMVGEIVRELGYTVSGVAGTIATARLQIAKRDFDAVLLDIDLGGEYHPETADILLETGVPFAVADPWEDILDDMSDSVTVQEGGYQSRTETIIHRAGDGYERVASADVLLHVLRISAAQQNSAHGQRLAHAMARVGWNRNKSGLVSINGRPVRGYVRPDRSVSIGASPLTAP